MDDATDTYKISLYSESDWDDIRKKWVLPFSKLWINYNKTKYPLSHYNARISNCRTYVVFETEADKLEFMLTYG